jgi:hypothetical protein
MGLLFCRLFESVCCLLSPCSLRASSFALHSWSVMFEGSGMWEIPLSLSWWCSPWSISVGALFFDLLCGGIVSCFSAETWWAPILGGSENRMKSTNTSQEQKSQEPRKGDKESPKACTHFKSCESFYTCPHAPFYRETKGLLHSENTIESKEYS